MRGEIRLPVGSQGGEPRKGLIVRTTFGWGRIRELRGTTMVVKLDWHALLYTQPAEILESSRAPLGACVQTVMGPGVLVDFHKRDRTHVVRLWNRIGCDGTALAYLRPEAILRIIKGSPGLEVITPQGPGQLLAYFPDRKENAYLVKLAGPQSTICTFSAQQVECPRARVQPLLESVLGRLQQLWRGQLHGQLGRVRLTLSQSRERLCLGIEDEDGKLKMQTELSSNPKQLAEMIEGQGAWAVDGVRGWLKEEKISDWVEHGRSRLYGFLNPDGQVEQKGGIDESSLSFWDLPSLLGVSTFNLHGVEDLKEAWEAARLGELMSFKGPWQQLGKIIEGDDRLDDIITEVKHEWRVLNQMRDRFRHTKTIERLLQGMSDLLARFQTLSDAPEFAFLRKRGIFFMNTFLHPAAPSMTKAKALINAAQSRVEQHLEDPQPLWTSLTSALGLGVLVDLESLLRTNLLHLQSFVSALDFLRTQGFSVEGLDRLETSLLILFDLVEHSSLKPPSTVVSTQAADHEVTKLLKDLRAPKAVNEVVKRLAEGRYSLQEAVTMILSLLDTDDMVGVASELIKHGEALLARLELFRSSPAFRAFLMNLSDSSLEERLFQNLESLNPEDFLNEAETALTDGTARQRLLSQLTDYCLDFLLDYLPSMAIPAVTGLKEDVEYTISHLDLSGFKLKKEDVEVVLGQGGTEQEVLVVNVRNIAAEFKALEWSYKQLYFPFMQGDGVADANVVGGAIRLGFRVKRREVPASGDQPAAVEPVVCVSSKQVTIAHIDLRVDQCAMAWLYNLLASLFSESVRDYITKSLHETLSDNMADLLLVLNDYARSAWPIISRVTGLELKSLPSLTEEDEMELTTETVKREARIRMTELDLSKAPPLPTPPGPLDLQVLIRSKRHLGMHLDVNEIDNIITIRGITPDGDFARSLPPNLRPTRLIGATWIGINNSSLAGFPVIRVIPTIRKLPRPLTLHLRLQPAPIGSPAGPSSPATSLATTTLTFHEPSAGIRFKPSTTLSNTVAVSGFTRGENDTLLPAEASGVVKIGQVLVAVNGTSVRGLTVAYLTRLLKDQQRPMTLLLCDSPDSEFRFEEGQLIDLSVAAFERDVVITGLMHERGPLEATGLCHIGDRLLHINGSDLPTPQGYVSDLDLLRNCTYPCHLIFGRHVTRPDGQVVSMDEYHVILEPEMMKGRRWGVLFVRGKDDRPVIAKWNGIPGPAQASGVVRPGMAVIKVGEKWVAEMVAEGRSIQSVAEAIMHLKTPVTLTLRAMDLYVQWLQYTP